MLSSAESVTKKCSALSTALESDIDVADTMKNLAELELQHCGLLGRVWLAGHVGALQSL